MYVTHIYKNLLEPYAAVAYHYESHETTIEHHTCPPAIYRELLLATESYSAYLRKLGVHNYFNSCFTFQPEYIPF